MRVLIQRVSRANITVDWTHHWSISAWYVCYVSISTDLVAADLQEQNTQIETTVQRILHLPLMIWEDEKLSTTLVKTQWDLLIVPNFTLRWRNKKWLKVDFTKSWGFKESSTIFDRLMQNLYTTYTDGSIVQWVFGSSMQIDQTVDGPVNFMYER